MAISEMKWVESYPYPVKESQRYINPNSGRLFVHQPSKRENDRDAHLNYYASAYNMGRVTSITSQDKTKPNTTKTSIHP